MPKRKCTFNISLQNKYPFIKQRSGESDVTCEKCRTDFSVGHGGASDIEKHLKSEKHKLSDQAAASSSSMLSFFKRTNLATSKDLDIAAAEGAWAYHTVQENHSFRSNDCASNLIQTCFEQKFRCARTKSQAIVVNVLAPMAMDELKEHLHEAHCISLLTDASNHGSIKLFPVLVRYFVPYEGVRVRILEFQKQPGESSDIIVDYLKEVLSCNDLNKKIVAFCADNTNCNFGGKNRKGINNVYAKLNLSVGRQLIGIGCGAHIIHNAIKTAADCLPVDFECIIVKIYSFFYIYSIRVEVLKEFCDSTDTEYQKLLGYSKTRWLALMPALERILKMFQPLKTYFLSIDKCPTILKTFFENPSSELWLYFLHAQTAIFHQAVLKIEGQNVSAIESANEINRLRDNLELKENSIFLPHSVRNLLVKLQKTDVAVDEQNVKTAAADFYKTSKEYLEQWCQFNAQLAVFEWSNLRKVPTWEDVQNVTDLLITQRFLSRSQDTEVFDEFSLISSYVTVEKIKSWNDENVATEDRWVELFKHFRANNLNCTNFRTIIEYVLCMPGSNAPVERVFSLMNKIWTSEKTQLSVTVLKAILITKTNINKQCNQLHSYLKTRPDILKLICSADKYKTNT